MYIRKKANMHEVLCGISPKAKLTTIKRERERESNIPCLYRTREQLNKREKYQKTCINISCSNNYAAFPDQIITK